MSIDWLYEKVPVKKIDRFAYFSFKDDFTDEDSNVVNKVKLLFEFENFIINDDDFSGKKFCKFLQKEIEIINPLFLMKFFYLIFYLIL